MIEKEYKTIVNEKQYEQIKNMFNWDRNYYQVNYYYDTDNLYLYNNDISFRVRDKNGIMKVQIKLPDKAKDGVYKSREEIAYEIDTIPKSINTNKFIDLFPWHTYELTRLGGLKTQRFEISVQKDLLICLDKNEYLGCTDFELEIEFKEDSRKIIELINDMNILCIEKGKGKYSRFIQEYLKGKDGFSYV